MITARTGLINPAAGFEDRVEEAARAQFWDLQDQIPHLSGQGAGPANVAEAAALAWPGLRGFL